MSIVDFKEYNLPDARGHFGKYGGSYVPETLVPALADLEKSLFRSDERSRIQQRI